MAKTTALSFVAEGTRIVGDIQSNARLMVEGRVEGNIRCSELTIASSGRVVGDLQAGTVFVAGRHTGTVVAHRKLTIHARGSVEGAIFTRILVVEEGGSMDGDVKVMSEIEEFPEYVL